MFHDVTFSKHSGLVWMLADGDNTESGDDGETDAFAYRLTGVLAQEAAKWRWLVLVGSEPTAPNEQHVFDAIPVRTPGVAGS